MSPFVTVHVAQSLDGRIAFDGAPAELSTPDGRRAAHAARAANDAVLVGVGTVRTDDPQLTVREAEGSSPLRVVLSSALDVPPGARMLRGGALVIGARGRASDAARAALLAAGVDVAVVEASADGMVSLEHALVALGERGVKTLLVEGGARILTSFFRERRVHRVRMEIAMRLLGAPNTATLGHIGVDARLANVVVERLGTNVFVRGDVV